MRACREYGLTVDTVDGGDACAACVCSCVSFDVILLSFSISFWSYVNVLWLEGADILALRSWTIHS